MKKEERSGMPARGALARAKGPSLFVRWFLTWPIQAGTLAEGSIVYIFTLAARAYCALLAVAGRRRALL